MITFYHLRFYTLNRELWVFLLADYRWQHKNCTVLLVLETWNNKFSFEMILALNVHDCSITGQWTYLWSSSKNFPSFWYVEMNSQNVNQSDYDYTFLDLIAEWYKLLTRGISRTVSKSCTSILKPSHGLNFLRIILMPLILSINIFLVNTCRVQTSLLKVTFFHRVLCITIYSN